MDQIKLKTVSRKRRLTSIETKLSLQAFNFSLVVGKHHENKDLDTACRAFIRDAIEACRDIAAEAEPESGSPTIELRKRTEEWAGGE